MLKFLVKIKAKIQYYAFFDAIRDKNMQIIKYFIKINKIDKLLCFSMYLALLLEYYDIAQYLVKKGFNYDNNLY